jgi:hypothetical protein
VTCLPRAALAKACNWWRDKALDALLVKTVRPHDVAMFVACGYTLLFPQTLHGLLSPSPQSLCWTTVMFGAAKLSSTEAPSYVLRSPPSLKVPRES